MDFFDQLADLNRPNVSKKAWMAQGSKDNCKFPVFIMCLSAVHSKSSDEDLKTPVFTKFFTSAS